MKGRIVTRRNWLRQSGFCAAAAGLGIPVSVSELLRLRTASAAAASDGEGSSATDTAVIFVSLGGGPSQFETYDPKPDALADYRGSFGSVKTKVAGVHFCELLPQQAKLMDKLAIIRSITHRQASHIAEHIVETGYNLRNPINSLRGEMPSVGSVVSKVRGLSPAGIPAYVALPERKAYAGAHWLGGRHRLFPVNGDPDAADFSVKNITLGKDLNVARLEDRRTLHADLDAASRRWEVGGTTSDPAAVSASFDAFNGQAFDLLTGETGRRAFDISAEPDKIRDAYGRNALGQRMLLARRLVEAGVPFVKVRCTGWDDHKDLPGRIRPRAAEYDPALAAMITDLHERGLERKVLVVAMGEFGRTPRINGTGGRDHWPAVGNALISGGGFRMGQVIGASDDNGAAVTRSPYAPQNVLAMVYRHLGIDPAMTFDDFSGRPRYVLEERRPITELL